MSVIFHTVSVNKVVNCIPFSPYNGYSLKTIINGFCATRGERISGFSSDWGICHVISAWVASMLSWVKYPRQEESCDKRLLNHYWSQSITFNGHCICILLTILQTVKGAEEFFHSHIRDSKAWTESCRGVAVLAVAFHLPVGIFHGILQELQRPAKPLLDPTTPAEGCVQVTGGILQVLGHRFFGCMRHSGEAVARPLCWLLCSSEQSSCHVLVVGTTGWLTKKLPDLLQFSVCEIK